MTESHPAVGGGLISPGVKLIFWVRILGFEICSRIWDLRFVPEFEICEFCSKVACVT